MNNRILNKLLICDDHELYRTGLKAFAIDYFNDDIEIKQAKTGEEALILFEKFNPEIVFLDIEMPIINGIEVCKKIKEEAPQTIVIMISMHTEKIMYGAVKKAKANGFITKGDANDKIAECIDYIKDTGLFYSSLNDQFSSKGEAAEFGKIIDQLNDMTNTEKKVLKLVLEAKSSEEIADILFVSKKSVNNYRNRVCRKLNLPNENNSLNRWLAENQSALKVFFS